MRDKEVVVEQRTVGTRRDAPTHSYVWFDIPALQPATFRLARGAAMETAPGPVGQKRT